MKRNQRFFVVFFGILLILSGAGFVSAQILDEDEDDEQETLQDQIENELAGDRDLRVGNFFNVTATGEERAHQEVVVHANQDNVCTGDPIILLALGAQYTTVLTVPFGSLAWIANTPRGIVIDVKQTGQDVVLTSFAHPGSQKGSLNVPLVVSQGGVNSICQLLVTVR